MGEEMTDADWQLMKLSSWVASSLLRQTRPKTDIRMTTLETGETIDVLMVISIDDKQN